MKRLLTLLGSITVLLALFGCAHPITMNPDLAAVKAQKPAVVDRTVGYYIADASRAIEVTTGGGGGDKVRYFPYRDLEPGFYKALSESFRDVRKIQNPADATAVAASGISLLITPEISTISSSESLLTWPPTQFTVNLVCKITDTKGVLVTEVRVSGYGQATFDEFKSNFSLAAVRASNNALGLLIKALGETPALRP